MNQLLYISLNYKITGKSREKIACGTQTKLNHLRDTRVKRKMERRERDELRGVRVNR